jgi:hypothetical protein
MKAGTKNTTARKRLAPPVQRKSQGLTVLSKDEALDQLAEYAEMSRRLASQATGDPISVLAFLKEALLSLSNESRDEVGLELEQSSIPNYSSVAGAVAPILEWMAARMHARWNDLDAAYMKIFPLVRDRLKDPTVRRRLVRLEDEHSRAAKTPAA